ncbi:protein shisa-1-like [Heteronotia binoei]|uniref:protein shisa-1-like n=1 Tax=Heteronotia binoei TaxID=13085 RepID=UPI00292F0A30|nr:protein shisa-1-like [Heteronotia binoei]
MLEQAGAMERVGLCFFLVLFPGAVWADEICYRWTEGVPYPVEVFHCPTQEDRAGVNFCCGTCYAPFCCSSEETRLDQDQCPGSVQWNAGSPHLMTNISEDLLTATTLSNFIAAMLVFGVMAIVVLDVFLCCYVILHCSHARDEARQRSQATEDRDPSSHDSSPRGYLYHLKRQLSNLSMRVGVDNPLCSYGACDDQVVPPSAEDTAPPQDSSLPYANTPVWF